MTKCQIRTVLAEIDYVRLFTDGKSVIAVHTESGTIAPLRLQELKDRLGVNNDEFVGIIKGMLMRIEMPKGAEITRKECFGILLELADHLGFDGLCVAVQGLELDRLDIAKEIEEIPPEAPPVPETVMADEVEESSEEDSDSDWWL